MVYRSISPDMKRRALQPLEEKNSQPGPDSECHQHTIYAYVTTNDVRVHLNMASRYELFDRMYPGILTFYIEYDIMLQEIASSDIVECVFSPYDSFQR